MEDKKIIENDSQLIVGVNEKISCGKAAFLGMQHCQWICISCR